jgi:SAM-dependent methyltransferase
VSAKSVSIARDRNIERCALSAYDGGSLPFADGRFDLSLAVNVFHHIPPGSRRAAVAEMQRTLKPGGYLVIFEHNPYNPVTRRVVRECPFDEDAVLLRPPETRSLMTQSGLRVVRTMFLIFVPPRLTALLSLEKHLTALPLGAQYGVFARSAPLR